MHGGIQIGQLLIEQGVLTETQVQHILKVQKMSHRPFGDLAERLYGISPKAVEDAWVEQYLRTVGVVDLDARVERGHAVGRAPGRGAPRQPDLGQPTRADVQGLAVDDYSRTMMDKTLAELEEERAGVAHLL